MIVSRLNGLKRQIGRRYAGCSLDSFELSVDLKAREKQSTIVAKLREYSAEICDRINTGCGIAMFGGVGTGKDFLMSTMLFAVVRAGFSVQWRDGMSLTREFRSVLDGDLSESKILEPLTACDVLAISDPLPPVGGLSPFSMEKLLAVVDRRYRDSKSTWLTLNVTNRTEADQRLSPQIVDRITDGAMCLSFDWPSFRLTRRWEGPTNA